MAKKIKGIVLEIGGDTQPLNKALEGANKQSRDLQSELRQVERLLKLDPKNTELLAQKQKLLTDAVSNTKDKLDTLREAEKQVQEQFKRGEVNEEQYRALQREIIKTEQDLKRFEKQLRDTGMTAEKLGKKFKDAGSKMSDIGKSMTTKVTAPILGAAAAVGVLAVKAGQTADRLLDLRDITGLSTDSIQEWQYVANQAGVESETMTNAVEGLVRKIPQLESEAGRATEQLAKMGITFADLKEMSPDEQMDTLMNMLAEMEDPLERNAIGAQLFGGAWKDLAPILGMGADGIAAVRQEARDLGIILDEDSIVKANEFRQQLDKLKATVSAIAFSIGADLGAVLKDEIGPIINDTIIPALKGMAEKIANIVKWFVDLDPKWQKIILAAVAFAAALGPLLMVFGPLISGIGTLITGLGAMSAAMTGGASIVAGLTAGFPALGAAITLLTGPIGIVIAAIAGLVAAGVLIYKNWDEIKEALDRVWGAIVNFFTKTIPEAINKGLKWFSELPGKVAKFMNELPGKIGHALGVALGNIIKFGIDAINWAIAEVPKFIESMMKFIRELPGKIWEQLVAALGRVKEWGNNLISWARSTLPGVISNIVSFFRELPGKLLEIGKDIVRGLWNGISSMASWIRDKVSDFVGGIVGGVKGVLGIRSPSAVFMDIGENLSLGLAEGIKEAKAAVDSALSGLISPQINVGLAGASPTGMGAITNTFVIQNMSVRSDQDIKLIAKELHNLQQQSARGRGMR